MATVIADTSFLFSLYGRDAHTPAAQAWVQQFGLPISVTVFNRYELGNALRFGGFRKAISQADVLGSLAAVETDMKNGHLRMVACDLAAIFAEAALLSELYTLNGGHRSFDILHVAAAKFLEATLFLSFDINQRKLATSTRMKIGP